MARRTLYPDGTKTCRTCSASKPLTDFYFRTDKSGSRPISYCKPCSIERSITNWSVNREQINARRNARRRSDPSVRLPERLSDRFGSIRRNARARCKQYGITFEVVDYQAVVDRDGMCCQICLSGVTWATLTLDHLVPLSRGGRHIATNLQVAHRKCNSRKGTRLPGEALKPEKIVHCPRCAHEFVL